MIISIDLGPTDGIVAVWRNGAPALGPNVLRGVLTPSAVSTGAAGAVITGTFARDHLRTHPDRTVATFKRATGADRIFRLGAKRFRAEELSALVLMALRAATARRAMASGSQRTFDPPSF